ncbi:hypothetical protein ABTX34_27115 [Streptomyces sp. NPDC096538]|uniref:hypothetical protein n=1 Tax=Streptomyces sp. NPDC096538 TaxID=3155427 RepID=UPI00332CCDBF
MSGQLGQDYGACSNPVSPFDGRVRFEHDGCQSFGDRPDGAGAAFAEVGGAPRGVEADRGQHGPGSFIRQRNLS